jgi:hypothetical protein
LEREHTLLNEEQAQLQTRLRVLENLRKELQVSQGLVRESFIQRDGLLKEVGILKKKYVQHQEDAQRKHTELIKTVASRNHEIKLLMYRIQELSSKYVPVKNDPVDHALAKWINGYRPAVPFFRLSPGYYLFGRRQVHVRVQGDKPVFRVGGGYVDFEKFLEKYAAEELEKLLTHETGTEAVPKSLVHSRLSQDASVDRR